jgi:phenylalanyl-tRNA synthetase beta chain
MRQTLLFSGLENVARNVNNKNANLRFFEFGKVYALNPATEKGDDVTTRYQEREELALFVTGKNGEDSWNHRAEDLDVFYLKNMIANMLVRINFPVEQLSGKVDENPRMFSDHYSYYLRDEKIATFGVLSPSVLKAVGLKKPVCYAELDWQTIVRHVNNSVEYGKIATYPAVKRDLALVVDKAVTYETLEQIGFKYGSKLIKQISLFDVYEGDRIEQGKKSYALNFVLQHPDKTLTDEEINKVMNKLIAAYEREAGASLRN